MLLSGRVSPYTRDKSVAYLIQSISNLNSIQFNSILFNIIQFNSFLFNLNSIQFNQSQFNSIQNVTVGLPLHRATMIISFSIDTFTQRYIHVYLTIVCRFFLSNLFTTSLSFSSLFFLSCHLSYIVTNSINLSLIHLLPSSLLLFLSFFSFTNFHDHLLSSLLLQHFTPNILLFLFLSLYSFLP